MSSLPSGTVTFFFTDIEGSTSLWQQHPQAMPAALVLHHRLVREAIESQGGHVFQVVGDAFCAAFARAPEALRAALAAQRGLAAATWPATGPLRVRIGLHAGEAEIRDREYLSGTTLIRAQRCMAAGHGGQVLLTAAVQQLTLDDLPADARLVDLGSHRLKDLLRPEHLFQLDAAGLPASFPPLRTLDVHAGNLPSRLTSFIGREHDQAEVRRLLDTTRLLTLTGVGGTGKTRLALEVAGGVRDQFADGVWLVELGPLADPALVPQAIASALDLREQPGRPLLETLADTLRSRRALLLLDNCEHLVEACAQLAETLLRACPYLTILATSREAIGISGELAWYVPALSTPHPHHLPADGEALLSELSHYEAVRLFVDRARAVQPGFTLSEQNAASVVRICHQLDGIPLAIELATARLKALSLDQIAARLDDRFTLLTTGSRTALPRHQALRAAIDWSYDLLPAAESALFNRLSVFAGGWTLEAAEEITKDEGGIKKDEGGRMKDEVKNEGGRMKAELNPPSAFIPIRPALDGVHPSNVLDLLTRLVDKSLVQLDEQAAGEQRYRMLETIRQYAREKLAAAQQAESVQMRHLNYFLGLARQAEPRLRAADQVTWLDRLEAEHDNLRAALDWALQCGEVEAALQLGAGLSRFWYIRGYWSEGREWLARALAATGTTPAARQGQVVGRFAAMGATAAGSPQGPVVGRFAADAAVSDPEQQGAGEHFAATSTTPAAAKEQVGDNIASVTTTPGSRQERPGDNMASLATTPGSGQAQAEDGFALDPLERGLVSARAYALNGAAWLADESGPEVAYYRESLSLFRALGDSWGTAFALRGLGATAAYRDAFDEARRYLDESLALFSTLNDPWGIALVRFNRGWFESDQDEHEPAQAEWEEGLRLFEQSGDRWGIAVTRGALSYEYRIAGDYKRAAALSRESLALFKALGDKAGIATSLSRLAGVALRRDEFKQAAELFAESIALNRDLGYDRNTAVEYIALATIACYEGDYARSEALREQSLAVWRDLANNALGTARVNDVAAMAAAAQGDAGRAEALWTESLAVFRERNDRPGMVSALSGLARVALQRGLPERAQALVEECLALSRAAGDRQLMTHAISMSARVALARADDQAAAEGFRQVLSLRRETGARRTVAESLEGLATVAMNRRQTERVVRLAGAAAAVRAAIGVPLEPVARPAYDRMLEAARAQLGDTAFASAWAAAGAQTLEQAIAEAMSDAAL